MAKPTQKQLELTAGKSFEELLLATAPHIDPESSAFKEDLAKVEIIEKSEAARAVLDFNSRASAEEFDWDADDSVILREQRATAAYRNRHGELIIRQRAGCWADDGDTFVFISQENEIAFLDGLAKKAKES